METTNQNLRQHIVEKNKLKAELNELKLKNERLERLLNQNEKNRQLEYIAEQKAKLFESLKTSFSTMEINQISIESVMLSDVDFEVFNRLKQNVCDVCCIEFSSLFTTNRKPERVLARNILRYYLRYHFQKNLSLKDISKLTGRSDHSTIIHSIKDIEYECSPNAPKTRRNKIINLCLIDMITIENETRIYSNNEFNNFSL